MNVVGDLSMQKHMEEKVFVFKKSLCFIVYIVTLLLEFVPYCPMYLFHHVQCIGVSSDSIVESYQEKMHDFLARKVFACVLTV